MYQLKNWVVGTIQKNSIKTNIIPITIAAKQNKTMQIAVKHAEIWESSYLTPDQFSSLNKNLKIHREIQLL